MPEHFINGLAIRCPTHNRDGTPAERAIGCGGTDLYWSFYEQLYDCGCGIWFEPESADPPHSTYTAALAQALLDPEEAEQQRQEHEGVLVPLIVINHRAVSPE